MIQGLHVCPNLHSQSGLGMQTELVAITKQSLEDTQPIARATDFAVHFKPGNAQKWLAGFGAASHIPQCINVTSAWARILRRGVRARSYKCLGSSRTKARANPKVGRKARTEGRKVAGSHIDPNPKLNVWKMNLWQLSRQQMTLHALTEWPMIRHRIQLTIQSWISLRSQQLRLIGEKFYTFSVGRVDPKMESNSGLRHRASIAKCLDTEISLDHDMLDQSNWDAIWRDLDEYDGRLLSPPCGTFSSARRAGDGGPKPLRSCVGPGRYGLSHLTPPEKEKVRVGNVLAIRSSRVCKRSQQTKKPWILEQPHHRQDKGKTSMFTLDEFVELLEMDGVIKYTFDQCMFGAMWEKTTDLLSNIPGLEMFNQRCNHPKKSWTIPWSGEVIWAAHPPLKGRQLAIPSEEWVPQMLMPWEPKGDYLTRKAAAYPCAMNKALAQSLAAAVKACKIAGLSNEIATVHDRSAVAQDSDGTDPKPTFSLPLRGSKLDHPQIDDRYSLRNVHKSVGDRMLYIGKQLSNLLDRRLDENPQMQDAILENLGRPVENIKLPEEWIESLRNDFLEILSRNRRSHMDESCSTQQVNTIDYRTVIRAELMKYWAYAADDPGAQIADWLIQGAQAGLACSMEALDPICPTVENEELELEPNDLFTRVESFENYTGVDDDPDAIQALHSYRDKGYLAEFSTYEQLKTWRPLLADRQSYPSWVALNVQSSILTPSPTLPRIASSLTVNNHRCQWRRSGHTSQCCLGLRMLFTHPWRCLRT